MPTTTCVVTSYLTNWHIQDWLLVLCTFFITDDYIHVWHFTLQFFLLILMGLTSSTFSIFYLVEGCNIYYVYILFNPVINSWNFANRSPNKYFVKKYASLCSVLQYEINMLPLTTRYFTKKRISMWLESLVHGFFPLFSIFIQLWLSWSNMFYLTLYRWGTINWHIHMLYVS